MSDSTRSQLANLLGPLLPNDYRIVTTEVALEGITKPVVKLSQQRIERHTAAPNTKHLVTFTVYVIAPGKDFSRSEDLLDDEVQELLFAINRMKPSGAIGWTTAEKVQVGDNLAYSIAVTVTTDAPTN